LRDYTAQLVRWKCNKTPCKGARPFYNWRLNCSNGHWRHSLITAIRVALLVAMLAAPSVVSAQASAPAAPDVLRELLVEVRALRLAMEHAASLGTTSAISSTSSSDR
jgi:hypothetical protein